MIIEFEVSRPFQKKPGHYRSNVTVLRVWWLWFAAAILRGRSDQRTRYTWEEE